VEGTGVVESALEAQRLGEIVQGVRPPGWAAHGFPRVDRDRLDEARTMFEASLDTWEAVGGPPGRAYALNNLAEALRLQGRLDDARALHDEAISIRRQANLQRDLATSLANLGLLQIDAGSLDDARATLDRAREAVEAAEDPTTRADWLYAFGELHRRADSSEDALEAHREALELRRSLDQSAAIARSQIAVARLLLDPAPTDAEDLARQAWNSSQLDGRPADEARAAAVVLEALIRLDATADTVDLFEETEAVAADTTQPAVRIELGLAKARQLHQRGDRRQAMDLLATLDRDARSSGLLALARDIRRTADALGS
ncbi:MAG: tetratricopeptide repeat protein, partial [Acidobacteriota bacterium]